MSAPPVITARQAALAYSGTTSEPVLTDLHFDVGEGESVALIGPNGAGKSTLIQAVLGIVPVVHGTLEVLGQEPGDREALQRIGYLPQRDGIDPEFPISLKQVVELGLTREAPSILPLRREQRERVTGAIERVGLRERQGAHFGSLSGGQQQRGLLARALVSNPRLILLDEPFNGLDAESRERLVDLLLELRAEGVAIMVSTHDPSLADAVCSHVLELDGTQVSFSELPPTGIDE